MQTQLIVEWIGVFIALQTENLQTAIMSLGIVSASTEFYTLRSLYTNPKAVHVLISVLNEVVLQEKELLQRR